MTPDVIQFPFGRHKGKPLTKVPVDYLAWVLRTVKLGIGFRAAVAAELTRRGIPTSAPAPDRPLRRCLQHPNAQPLCSWMEDCAGRRIIRATYPVCWRAADFPPHVEPYVAEAAANASSTPILDVLVRLGEIGVELESDGRAVRVPAKDYQCVPPDLHAVIRQCRHQLATMMGNKRRHREADKLPGGEEG
jgi:hypothetical protein